MECVCTFIMLKQRSREIELLCCWMMSRHEIDDSRTEACLRRKKKYLLPSLVLFSAQLAVNKLMEAPRNFNRRTAADGYTKHIEQRRALDSKRKFIIY